MKRLLALTLLSTSLFALAVPAKADDLSSRARHKVTVQFGLDGDPFGFTGGSLGYNIAPFLRVSAGYSTLTYIAGLTTTTASFLGGGLKFFVPSWNLSPYASVGYVNTSATGSFTLGGGSASGSFGAIYYGAGLEWATNYGLMLSFGEQTASGAYSGVGFLPSFSLGWAF